MDVKRFIMHFALMVFFIASKNDAMKKIIRTGRKKGQYLYWPFLFSHQNHRDLKRGNLRFANAEPD
jgi:hypothetical protein